MTLAQYFRKQREKAGYTQKELSDLLGFKSSQFVSKCERGECRPCRKKLAMWVQLIKGDPKKVLRIWSQDYIDKLKRDLGLL